MKLNETIAKFDAECERNGIRFFRARTDGRLIVASTGAVAPVEIWPNVWPTLKLADEVRARWTRSVKIVCGFRDPAKAPGKGQSANSQHYRLAALDLAPVVRNAEGKEIDCDLATYNAFEAVVAGVVKDWRAGGNVVGFGRYPGVGNRFCHVDCNARKADANWKEEP